MSTNKSTDFFSTNWVSQAEAARLRGVSRQAINKLIKRGRIKTYRISNVVFVDRKQIENFKAKSVGRPKKDQDG